MFWACHFHVVWVGPWFSQRCEIQGYTCTSVQWTLGIAQSAETIIFAEIFYVKYWDMKKLCIPSPIYKEQFILSCAQSSTHYCPRTQYDGKVMFSVCSQEGGGGGILWHLVPHPFPGLWSKVLSEGRGYPVSGLFPRWRGRADWEGVPQSGPRTGVPPPTPPQPGPGQGTPSPTHPSPDSTCHR